MIINHPCASSSAWWLRTVLLRPGGYRVGLGTSVLEHAANGLVADWLVIGDHEEPVTVFGSLCAILWMRSLLRTSWVKTVPLISKSKELGGSWEGFSVVGDQNRIFSCWRLNSPQSFQSSWFWDQTNTPGSLTWSFSSLFAEAQKCCPWDPDSLAFLLGAPVCRP